MNPEQYERVRELFHELSDASHEQRRRVFAERGVDDAIAAEVEALLGQTTAAAFDESHLGEVGQRLVDEPDRTVKLSEAPERIGPFRVLRRLGEGGMGVVYQARRDDSELVCALKVARPGVGTRANEQSRRFRREVEVLRDLRHPGIAAFYEAGEAEVPTVTAGTVRSQYLAMEYVDGETIHEFVERRELDHVACCELVARICDALHYAHGRGVVHRDLTPANVLVVSGAGAGDAGQPKILDFGIARLHGSNWEVGSLTRSGMVVGTPNYMSPEQVLGRPGSLDARSDVYSLGVLFFELLSGSLPYDLQRRALPDVARITRDDEPVRLAALMPRLRGDLETIVAKTLEKEPAQRYRTAADLATDLRNYVDGRPISARPAMWHYRLRKFTHRNPGLVASLATLFLTLAAGLAGTIAFGVSASNARQVAERRTAVERTTAYRARIAAAAGAVGHHDVTSARRHLERIPEARRAWEWHHLHARLDDSVRSVAIDAPIEQDPPLVFDRRAGALRTLSGGPSGWTVRSWSFDSLEPLPSLELRPFEHAALSADGEAVLLVGGGRVSVKRAADGRDIAAADLPSGNGEWSLAGSSGADRILLTSAEGSAYLLDATGKTPLAELTSRRPAHSPAVDPTGQWGAVIAARAHLLWRLEHSTEPQRLAPAVAEPSRLVFSPDGTRVASIGVHSASLDMWSLAADGPPAAEAPIDVPSGRIHAAAFSPTEPLIAITATDRTVRIRSTATGETAAVLAGHSGIPVAVAFSADGARLATIADDDTLRVWSPEGDPGVIRLPSYVYATGFNPSGSRFYVGNWVGPVRIHDADSGLEIARLPTGEPAASNRALAVDPTDRCIALSEYLEHGRVRVLDATTGEELARLPRPGDSTSAPTEPFDNFAIRFAPDGRHLAIQSKYTGVLVYDTTRWELALRSPTAPDDTHPALAFSPSGDRLAAAGPAASVVLLDAATLAPTTELRGHAGGIMALAFHPGGTELASASLDETIRVWDLDGADTAVLLGHTGEVFTVCYSPDGSRLFSGGADRVCGSGIPPTRPTSRSWTATATTSCRSRSTRPVRGW